MNRLLVLLALMFAENVSARNTNAELNSMLSVSPDTVRFDVATAEQRLVSQSLYLISARYNVDIAKSEVTQAKAWYNPNIIYTQSLYDPASGTWMDNKPSSGQVDFQIHELFSIAGRHINAVRLAQIDVQRNQLAFDDLARALKFEMYNDLADLYQAQQTDLVFAEEIDALDRVLGAAQQELRLGAAAGNDVIRLKAEKQSTLSDRLANLNFIEQTEAQLRVLLGYKENTYLKLIILPVPQKNAPSLDTLEQMVMKRPDVQLASADVKWNQQNLKLQRSEGAPDLLLGTEYDRRNSYSPNLWLVSGGIDIPIFNRNQGNIRAARYAYVQSQYDDTLRQNTARSEVAASYGQYLRISQALDSVNAQPGIISAQGQNKGSYSQDLDLMFQNAVTNFRSQRISLLEFLDQVRTYDDARRGLITLDSDYFRAAQQLNYAAGTTVIK